MHAWYRRSTKSTSRGLSARLEALARQHGLTLATVLQGAWTVLLSRLTNQNDVIYGIVSSGRQAVVPGIERMLGLLITTTPVRAQLNPADGPLIVLPTAAARSGLVLPHQHLPLAEIHKLAATDVLFDTLFTYENYPLEEPRSKPAQEICRFERSGATTATTIR